MRCGVQREDLRERVGRLGARSKLARQALERLAALRMVEPEPEQPGDGLGAEHAGGLEPHIACPETDGARRPDEPERADELGVELAHGDEPPGVGRFRVRLAESEDRLMEIASGQRVVGPEVLRVRPHDAGGDDLVDLGLRPAWPERLRGGL